jgi:hypothetical protein
MSMRNPGKRTRKTKPAHGWSTEHLDALVEEATIDANGDSEQVTGFYTMMENDLRLPFDTNILGVAVTVESIDFRGDDELVAVCRKGSTRQTISLLDLPLPSPPPEGAAWIAAYCHWRRWDSDE